MEYKINNFNLADISFDDVKSLKEYFEKSIFSQNIQYLLIGPNIINLKYSGNNKIQNEENKKIINTACRLIFSNLGGKSKQSVVMQTTSNFCAKSYLKKVCKDLDLLIREKIKKENYSEISKLLLFYDFFSFFTSVKDDLNDEISVCDFLIKTNYIEGSFSFDSIETLHENFEIIFQKSEKFNNLNIFYILMYNLPLDQLGSFILCDKTKEYFNVFSEQIEVEEFVKRYIFINQFSILHNRGQYEEFAQSDSNVDKIRNEYEYYKNLYLNYLEIRKILAIGSETERKIFEIFFAILLLSEYDIFEDSKAKSIIENVTKNTKQVDPISLIRSCLFSDYKFRIHSNSKMFENRNDDKINILQKISFNLNISEENIVFILLTDLQNERIKNSKSYFTRIRHQFMKTIYETLLEKIKLIIKSQKIPSKENESINLKNSKDKTNRLNFLIARTNQVYISSYVSTMMNRSNNLISAEINLIKSIDHNSFILINKYIRKTILSNYLQELKNFLFFKNAMNITSTLKDSAMIKIDYNSNFLNKLIDEVYNYKQLIDLYENKISGLLVITENSAYIPIFLHQFHSRFHKNSNIELFEARYLKVKHTFGTFVYDLNELAKEISNWNAIYSSQNTTIHQFLEYSPNFLTDFFSKISKLKKLTNELVYMNFLIKVPKYDLKDVFDDLKIGNIYLFYNNFFNYYLNMNEIRENILKYSKNPNIKLITNDHILFKSQIAKKFRISKSDYYHENGFVCARKNFSRVLDFNKNIANLIFKYNPKLFYYLSIKNVLNSKFSYFRLAINSVRVYLNLIKIYKEKKIFRIVKNLILDQIIEQYSINKDSRVVSIMKEINKRQEIQLDISNENFSITLPKLFANLVQLNKIWENYFADILFLEINKTKFTNSYNIDQVIQERITNFKILLFLFAKKYKFINLENLKKNGILHSSFLKNTSEEILKIMKQLHEGFKNLLKLNDIDDGRIEKNITLEKLIIRRMPMSLNRRDDSNGIINKYNNLDSTNKLYQRNHSSLCSDHSNNKIFNSEHRPDYNRYGSISPKRLRFDSSRSLKNEKTNTIYLRRLSNKIKIITDEELFNNLGKVCVKVRETLYQKDKDLKESTSVRIEYSSDCDEEEIFPNEHPSEYKFLHEKNSQVISIKDDAIEGRNINMIDDSRSNKEQIPSEVNAVCDSLKNSEKVEFTVKDKLSHDENPESNDLNESIVKIEKLDDEINKLDLARKIEDNEDQVKEEIRPDEGIINDNSEYEKEILITTKENFVFDTFDISKIKENDYVDTVKCNQIENRVYDMIEPSNNECNDNKEICNNNFEKNDFKLEIKSIPNAAYSDKEFNNLPNEESIENPFVQPLAEEIQNTKNPINDNNYNFFHSLQKEKIPIEEEKENRQLITFEDNENHEGKNLSENSKDFLNQSLKIDLDNYRFGSIYNFNTANQDVKKNDDDNYRTYISSSDSKISASSLLQNEKSLIKLDPMEVEPRKYFSHDAYRENLKEYEVEVFYSNRNIKIRKIKSFEKRSRDSNQLNPNTIVEEKAIFEIIKEIQENKCEKENQEKLLEICEIRASYQQENSNEEILIRSVGNQNKENIVDDEVQEYFEDNKAYRVNNENDENYNMNDVLVDKTIIENSLEKKEIIPDCKISEEILQEDLNEIKQNDRYMDADCKDEIIDIEDEIVTDELNEKSQDNNDDPIQEKSDEKIKEYLNSIHSLENEKLHEKNLESMDVDCAENKIINNNHENLDLINDEERNINKTDEEIEYLKVDIDNYEEIIDEENKVSEYREDYFKDEIENDAKDLKIKNFNNSNDQIEYLKVEMENEVQTEVENEKFYEKISDESLAQDDDLDKIENDEELEFQLNNSQKIIREEIIADEKSIDIIISNEVANRNKEEVVSVRKDENYSEKFINSKFGEDENVVIMKQEKIPFDLVQLEEGVNDLILDKTDEELKEERGLGSACVTFENEFEERHEENVEKGKVEENLEIIYENVNGLLTNLLDDQKNQKKEIKIEELILNKSFSHEERPLKISKVSNNSSNVNEPGITLGDVGEKSNVKINIRVKFKRKDKMIDNKNKDENNYQEDMSSKLNVINVDISKGQPEVIYDDKNIKLPTNIEDEIERKIRKEIEVKLTDQKLDDYRKSYQNDPLFISDGEKYQENQNIHLRVEEYLIKTNEEYSKSKRDQIPQSNAIECSNLHGIKLENSVKENLIEETPANKVTYS